MSDEIDDEWDDYFVPSVGYCCELCGCCCDVGEGCRENEVWED